MSALPSLAPPAPARTSRRPSAQPPVPLLLSLDRVPPAHVPWLWPGRVALGKLTLIAGSPGRGKSLLTIDLAARVTTGRAFPDAPQFATPQGTVLLVNAEDDAHDTIRPRLDAASADVTRVRLLAGVCAQQGDRPTCGFDLSQDISALESALRDTPDCRLVVIDPLGAYLGRDTHRRDAKLVAVLLKLAEVARQHHVAVVVVTHVAKGLGKAIHRCLGSLASVAAARTIWLLLDDPESSDQRLLVAAKNNLAPETYGLAFRIVSGPRIQFSATPLRLTAEDALSALPARPVPRGALAEAIDWLANVLAISPQPASVVKDSAQADGIPLRTLERAKGKLGVISAPSAFHGPWTWSLPAAPKAPSSQQTIPNTPT